MTAAMAATYIAVHDYDAQHTDELSFKVRCLLNHGFRGNFTKTKAGQHVVVTSHVDGGWWAGHVANNDQHEGWFPSTHVKKLGWFKIDDCCVCVLVVTGSRDRSRG